MKINYFEDKFKIEAKFNFFHQEKRNPIKDYFNNHWMITSIITKDHIIINKKNKNTNCFTAATWFDRA